MNAIPLRTLSTRQRLALLALCESPALEHDTDADENFLRFEAVFPSAHQTACWNFALSICGFGPGVDLRFILDGCDEETVAACVRALAVAAGVETRAAA